MPKSVHSFALSTRFLNAYERLNLYLRRNARNKEKVPPHQNLLSASDKIPPAWREDLHLYARLRNAIVHSETVSDYSPIAEPRVDVVENYERLVQHILKPRTVLSCAVPFLRIYSVSRGQNLFGVVQEMNAKIYTHAPLLEKDCVTGVFSENTIFGYLGRPPRSKIGFHRNDWRPWRLVVPRL